MNKINNYYSTYYFTYFIIKFTSNNQFSSILKAVFVWGERNMDLLPFIV